MRLMSRVLLPAFLMLLALGGSAPAADEPPIVKALFDGLAFLVRVRPLAETMDIAPDGTVRVSKVTLGADGGAEPAPISVEQLTLTGIRETIGRYDVEELRLTGITISMPNGLTVVLPSLALRTLTVRPVSTDAAPLEKARAASIPAKAYEIPEALILLGNESASVENMSWSWDTDPAGSPATARFGIGRLSAPAVMLREMLDREFPQLGYGAVEASLSGTWRTSLTGDTRRYDIEAEVTARDMGTLKASFSAGDVSVDFFPALLLADPSETGFERMLRAATFRGASGRYEDRSLMTRLMNREVSRRGADASRIIGDGLDNLRRDLRDFEGGRFHEQAIRAYSSFLADPRSLDGGLSPPAPLPGGAILDAMDGRAPPSVLLYIFNPTIEANR